MFTIMFALIGLSVFAFFLVFGIRSWFESIRVKNQAFRLLKERVEDDITYTYMDNKREYH